MSLIDSVKKLRNKIKKLDVLTRCELIYLAMDKLFFRFSDFGRIVSKPEQIYVDKVPNIYTAIPEEWVIAAANGEQPLRISVNPVKNPRDVYCVKKAELLQEIRKKTTLPFEQLKVYEPKVTMLDLIPYVERVHIDIDTNELTLEEKVKLCEFITEIFDKYFGKTPLIYLTGRGIGVQVFVDKPKPSFYRKILGGLIHIIYSESIHVFKKVFLKNLNRLFIDIDASSITVTPFIHCRVPFTINEKVKELVVLIQNNEIVKDFDNLYVEEIKTQYIKMIDVVDVVKKLREMFNIDTFENVKKVESTTKTELGTEKIVLSRYALEKKKVIEFMEKIVKTGVPDCLQRLIIHVVIPTMIHYMGIGKYVVIPDELLGFSIESAIDKFSTEVVNAYYEIKKKCMEFIMNSMKNFNHKMIDESWLSSQIKTQLRHKYSGRWLWKNCEDVKKQDPQCYDVLKEIGICRET